MIWPQPLLFPAMIIANAVYDILNNRGEELKNSWTSEHGNNAARKNRIAISKRKTQNCIPVSKAKQS